MFQINTEGTGNFTVAIGSFPSKEVQMIDIVKKLSTGCLPPSVRWVDVTQRFWLIEMPPRYIQITHGPVAGAGDKYVTSSTIPIPWQVYLFDMHAVVNPQIWFRTERITSFEDEVCHTFLSNVYSNARPCRSLYSSGPPSDMEGGPLARILWVIQHFWMSNFNGGHYINGLSSGVPSPGLPPELQALVKASKMSSVERSYAQSTWIPQMYVILSEMELPEVLNMTYFSDGKLQVHIARCMEQITPMDFLSATGLK